MTRGPTTTPVRKGGTTTAWASLATVVALAVGAAVLSLSSSPSTAGAPRGWKVVSYDDVYVDVPSEWPVVDGMHTGFCDGPFPDTPTAFVGPNLNGAPSCAATLRPTPALYGVWLYPSASPYEGMPTTLSSGQRVVEDDSSDWAASHLEGLWIHGVYVEIGIGPDAQLVKEIVHSIGFKKGIPNTRASGVCEMSNDPNAMPTPERLSKRLVLDHGSEVLEPPFPTQHAVMSASSAWVQADPKEPYEHYRLILARFFAQYPAAGSTPMNDGQLDWLIYASPISSSIQGCGGWGLDVFDATTGQGVESDGWSPGP
jgi:hypothetical protein